CARSGYYGSPFAYW
nr:immunoglobulin heavy chain junction region [Mus musculus]